MSIIEKLGITPIEYDTSGPFDLTVFDNDEVRELERQRSQMLEALIENVLLYYETFGECDGSNCIHIQNQISLIESATGKSWEEIKALMEDEG